MQSEQLRVMGKIAAINQFSLDAYQPCSLQLRCDKNKHQIMSKFESVTNSTLVYPGELLDARRARTKWDSTQKKTLIHR